MNDLTERFRAEHDNLSLAGEAAYEIERLTEEIENWKSLAKQINTDWIPANKKLTDRIEELESTLSEYANKANEDFNAGMQVAAQRCAEIANEYCRDSEGYHSGCDTEDKIIEEFGLEE
jgi:hypothetical protein